MCLRVICQGMFCTVVFRMLSDGLYSEFNMCWEYNVSAGNSMDNPAVITVIDGSIYYSID